jgi:predicted nucleic acid-binding Zn finger protein
MKQKANQWAEESESNPGKFYETVLWDDGSLSCNCPGWTRHVNADGSRNCRHIRKHDKEWRTVQVLQARDKLQEAIRGVVETYISGRR